MSPTQHPRIHIQDHGRSLATADIHTNSQVLSAAVHVEPGQLPTGTRTQLVDAILDSPGAVPPPGCRQRYPPGTARS